MLTLLLCPERENPEKSKAGQDHSFSSTKRIESLFSILLFVYIVIIATITSHTWHPSFSIFLSCSMELLKTIIVVILIFMSKTNCEALKQ